MHYLRRRANLAWHKAGLPSYSYLFDVVVNGVPGEEHICLSTNECDELELPPNTQTDTTVQTTSARSTSRR